MIHKIFNIKNLFLIIILLFVFPSIITIFNGNIVSGISNNFKVLVSDNNIINTISYAAFFIILFIIYFLFLKKRNKIFENTKEIFIFIVIVSVLFGLILPITSSDVFSYATIGEIQSSYGANPYYDKIIDVKQSNDTSNNQILNSITIWDNQLVIYGPLWSLICSIITFFSFSNVSVALLLFKVLAIVVHVVNAKLIYKITNKKFWLILYGLNPYILFETISNVHNDLYLIFFILLALFCFIKKKNLLLTLVFLACATCIKYITVLLVPLLLIYYYRNESIWKRILKYIRSGLLYAFFVIGIYLIYLRNFEMIFYVFIQQEKLRESLLTALYIYCGRNQCFDIYVTVSKTITITCIALYVSIVLRLLLKKEVKLKDIMNKWNAIVLVLILVYITNLCVWYFVWLFGTIVWQKSRNIRIAMYLPLIYELLVSYYYFIQSEIVLKSYWFSATSIVVLLSIFGGRRLYKFSSRHEKKLVGKFK